MESLLYLYEQCIHLLVLKNGLPYIKPIMYSHEFYDIGYREGQFQYDNCVTKELVIEYWNKGKILQFSITDYKYFDCIYAEDIKIDTMSDVDNPTNQEILELYLRLIN